MQSLKDALKKEFNLEEIRQRASSLSSIAKTEQEPEKYRCDKCKDMGGRIQRVALSDKPFDYMDKWEDCTCVRERMIERLMGSSKITEEFQQKTFHNFEEEGRPELIKLAYQKAGAYAKNFFDIRSTRKNSLALLGRPGSGKTHLAMAVCNYLLKRELASTTFLGSKVSTRSRTISTRWTHASGNYSRPRCYSSTTCTRDARNRLTSKQSRVSQS